MVFVLRVAQEISRTKDHPLFVVFVDLVTAYDSVVRSGLWKVLLIKGVPPNVVALPNACTKTNRFVSLQRVTLRIRLVSKLGWAKAAALPHFCLIFSSLQCSNSGEEWREGVCVGEPGSMGYYAARVFTSIARMSLATEIVGKWNGSRKEGLKQGCPASRIGSLRLLPWPTQQRRNWAMNRHAGRLCSSSVVSLKLALSEDGPRGKGTRPSRLPRGRKNALLLGKYKCTLPWSSTCKGLAHGVLVLCLLRQRLRCAYSCRRVSRSRRCSTGTLKMASPGQWLCFSETVKQRRTRVMFGYRTRFARCSERTRTWGFDLRATRPQGCTDERTLRPRSGSRRRLMSVVMVPDVECDEDRMFLGHCR